MISRQTPLTIRFAAVVAEGRFLVLYARGTDAWSPTNCDDALTLVDARKLADARKNLGYRTRIIEKKTGTEIG